MSQNVRAPQFSSGAQSAQQRGKVKKGVFIALGAVAAIVVVCIVVIGVAAWVLSHHKGSGTGRLAFGTEGSEPGMLEHPLYIGLDGNGNIYAGDLDDGRINVFDPGGKYLRQISVGAGTEIQGMAVASDGTVYVAFDGKIHRQAPDGNLDTLTLAASDYPDNPVAQNEPVHFTWLTLGPDGSLVAADDLGSIFRFSPDGTATLTIPFAFSKSNGGSDGIRSLAVDGSGNIYALGEETYLILKFDQNGNFLNQFGGMDENDPVDPNTYYFKGGHFERPVAIAVDSYGRIFVTDMFGVNIFDANEQYITYIKQDGYTNGIAIDPANNLYFISDSPRIIKMSVKAP
jgi:tripartite motif-containing protein 71